MTPQPKEGLPYEQIKEIDQGFQAQVARHYGVQNDTVRRGRRAGIPCLFDNSEDHK